MPRKSNVPIRICGSKTRTGCTVCKQRHIKCDEERPVCLNCQKKNRPCTYVVVQSDPQQGAFTTGNESLGSRRSSKSSSYLRWRTVVFESTPPPVGITHSLPKMNEATTNTDRRASQSQLAYQSNLGTYATATSELQHARHCRSPGLNKSISPYGLRELTELEAVRGFTVCLGKNLAGAFSDEIWCSTLPRMAQHEPSVWHGIAAVGMLHTGMRLGHAGAPEIERAIQQYGKAMSELNARLKLGESDGYKDVVLVSCILFTLFECLQNHVYSALRHISSGMKLLLGWSNNKSSMGGYLDYTSLQPIFLSLDSQALQLGPVDFRDYTSMPTIADGLSPSTSFATIDDAYLSLNHIFNRISHWAQWCEPTSVTRSGPGEDWIVAERRRIQSQLVEWDSAFNTSEPSYSESSILVILIQRKVLQVFFDRHADGPSELAWDKYLGVFQEAVDLAETYMKLTEDDIEESNTGPILIVAMDLVLPLFLISVKCRHSATRRRALRMLKNCNRKEGIWDSNMSTRIAQKMIQLEENCSENGFIPERARICELDIRLAEEEDEVFEIRQKKMVSDYHGSHHVETDEEAMAF